MLRRPAFRRLTAAWAVSNFGDSALLLTLPIWVKDLTGSDAAAGLVFLSFGLPALLAPLAGQLADRGSRRRLVVMANLVAAAGVMALAAVGGVGDVWIIYAVTFGYGTLGYVTAAAGSGLVRDLLADDELAAGNGVLSTIDQGMRLLSPLVGAGLYVAFGGFAVAVLTAVALVIAAAIALTVRVTESAPPAADEREGFWDEVTAGARHLRAVPVLGRLTAAVAVAFCVSGFSNSAIFAAIDQGLGRGSEFFGVLAAVQGGGSVLGGITAAALIGRLGERATLAVALTLLGAALGAIAFPSTVVFCGAAVAGGLAIPWMMVSFATIRQRLTPARLQGRVTAATNMVFNGPQTAGTAVGAGLIAVVDYRLLAVAMGVVVMACAVPVGSRRVAPTVAPAPG